ncbi:hypothetical protein QAD02_022757 [Eretmocerus hayati]|uniref:Uncharacterized protein n=1 Tax=Eretmocerus hayati TaxID=131215 RepID=A0ACC2PU07_9HYME|nr:hypothetical protein QAD02_022757 [Eretmocerus hayati]
MSSNKPAAISNQKRKKNTLNQAPSNQSDINTVNAVPTKTSKIKPQPRAFHSPRPILPDSDTEANAADDDTHSEIESEASESEDLSDISDIPSLDNPASCEKVIETKDSISLRNDHIMCFVSSSGKALDEGAKGLLANNRIPETQNILFREVRFFKRSNGKYIFCLCIKDIEEDSQSIVSNSIYKTFIKL